MLFKVVALALALFFRLAEAAAPETTHLIDKVERISFYSCYVGLRSLRWQYTLPRGGDYTCLYEPAVESLLYCMYQNIREHGHSNKTLEKSFKNVRSFCGGRVRNYTDVQFYSSLNNGSLFIQDRPIPGANITYPVKMNTTLRKGYYQSYHGYYYNRDIGNYFGGYICVYFFGVVLLAGLFRLFRRTPLQNTLLRLKIVNYLRGYGLIPSLGKSHAQPFSYLKVITGYLPTRFETLVILGYLALHTAFMACNYHYDPYNIIFKSRAVQVARFVGDRSGILSFAHFPLIILFAGRNNFLEWVSGLPFTSFITFHKWVGRIMFLDAAIHGVAYTRFTLLQGTYHRVIKRAYWKFGIVALVFGAVILFSSFAYFRRYCYETFLLFHIVFGALFLYTCWEHVVTFSGIEWIYAAIALWCYDRLVRLCRLCFIGFPKANLRMVGPDLVRVTVPKPFSMWHAKPGQYVFAHFLHPLYFWQSHPFTVMDSCVKEGELIIVFKRKKGITGYLGKLLARNNGELNMRVAIEGPYGTPSPAHHYDNVLLLTGGVGLPGPIYHAIDLGRTCAASGKKKVQLVAAVKGVEALEAFKPELMMLKDLPVDVHIYDTSKKAMSQKSASSDDEQNTKSEGNENVVEKLSSSEAQPDSVLKDDSVTGLDFTTFHQGRPDSAQLLNDMVEQPGSLAVVCCGPPTFVDTVRNASARIIIEKSNSAIEYFEEYQSW